MVLGMYGVAFWMPQILKEILGGADLSLLGWYNAIPFLAAIIGMAGDRLEFRPPRRAKAACGRRARPGVCRLRSCRHGHRPCRQPRGTVAGADRALVGDRAVLGVHDGSYGRSGCGVGVALINSIGNMGGFFGAVHHGVAE